MAGCVWPVVEDVAEEVDGCTWDSWLNQGISGLCELLR